ncbi:MAG: hypothetical protein GX485_04230 [Clostridiales bacterium]|nr:hypothetical protein [Clostridiales bacterium]
MVMMDEFGVLLGQIRDGVLDASILDFIRGIIQRTNRITFLFTGAVGYCLLQHAVQGWCPSIPFIRRAGIRTAKEIQDEKTVMKLMRGDFMQGIGNPDEMLRMAEM